MSDWIKRLSEEQKSQMVRDIQIGIGNLVDFLKAIRKA